MPPLAFDVRIGLRVHRGFLDWGDRDSYEFLLLCEAAEAPAGVPVGAGGRTTTFGSRIPGDTQRMLKELHEMKAADFNKDEL